MTTTHAPEVRMRIKAEPRLLGAVRGAVRAYLAGAGINGDRLDELVLAVDEACTNCIRHAYGGNPACSYSVELGEDERGIVVSVVDDGSPCPEAKLARRELEPPAREAVVPGGLGIQLIHRAFDEVHYAAQGEAGNRMEMRLHRGPNESKGNP
jgi:serine/threonine-protein kinase RsbW